jgi:hypothetical protein
MSDADLKAKARELLTRCKLSGPSMQTLQRVVDDGFTDESWMDPDAIAEGRHQRRTIRELCQLHSI